MKTKFLTLAAACLFTFAMVSCNCAKKSNKAACATKTEQVANSSGDSAHCDKKAACDTKGEDCCKDACKDAVKKCNKSAQKECKKAHEKSEKACEKQSKGCCGKK